ncbi:AraC family transcriptional regulator [Paraburkholderia phosphatilytica]|uniref:AraC family transcriptional regulator n=1 Tax=Paraburkholderia phosphatilytica TaxID=2282883 RepID=UPI000E4A626E|nr:AraC family transcriptional regulator [Paraburkholderia phosphatilytica]
MDLLSRLLTLMPVTGRLDVRCHFGAPWRIDEPPAGEREIAYHVLLRGEALVEYEGKPPLRMRAGDIVLFPSGGAHALHDGSGRKPTKATREVNGPLQIVTNRGRGEAADVLCGRFLVPAMPQQLLRDHLPGMLLVHSVRLDGNSDALEDDADAVQAEEARIEASRLARLIALMREEALEQGAGSDTLVNHLSGALFALTLRFASESGEPPRGLLALARQPRLLPALSAMFDEPGKPWTLPDLAELCHMSRATFVRHFDEAIGRSASDVLTEIRMSIAGRRLAQTRTPIAEIGEAVGYLSDAAFQRAFKKQVGMTPAQWRAQARADFLATGNDD